MLYSPVLIVMIQLLWHVYVTLRLNKTPNKNISATEHNYCLNEHKQSNLDGKVIQDIIDVKTPNLNGATMFTNDKISLDTSKLFSNLVVIILKNVQ